MQSPNDDDDDCSTLMLSFITVYVLAAKC